MVPKSKSAKHREGSSWEPLQVLVKGKAWLWRLSPSRMSWLLPPFLSPCYSISSLHSVFIILPNSPCVALTYLTHMIRESAHAWWWKPERKRKFLTLTMVGRKGDVCMPYSWLWNCMEKLWVLSFTHHPTYTGLNWEFLVFSFLTLNS